MKSSWFKLKIEEMLLLLALLCIPFDRYFLIYQPSAHSPGTTLGKVVVGLLLAYWLTKTVFVGDFKALTRTLRNSVCVLSILFLWSSFLSFMNSRNLAISMAMLIPRINLVVFLILMVNIIQSWDFLKKCIIVLLFASVFVCWAGFYEMITQTPVLETTYQLSQARTTLPQLDTGSYRLQGFGGDPDYHGAILVALGGMLLYYVFAPVRWKWKLVAIALFAAYIINIFATGSRSVWVGLSMLLPTFFLFARIRFKWLIVGVSGLFMVAAFGYLALTTNLATTERLNIDMTDPAIKSRLGDFLMGAKMFEDHPVVGIGLGNFFAQYYRYSHMVSGTLSPKWRPKQAQNGFVQTLAEQGLIGITIYLLLFLAVLRHLYLALRSRPSPEEHLLLVGLLACFFGLIGMTNFIPMTQQESTWIIFAFSTIAAHLVLTRRAEELAQDEAAKPVSP